jgi:hypothetical protein
VQDSQADIRKECLLIFLEISRGLQDEDSTISSKKAVDLPQEYSKYGYKRNAGENHKAISMASQQEVLDKKESMDKTKRGRQAKQTSKDGEQSAIDAMNNYMKRTIALIEKNENEKFINFALDLPNLNF